MIKKTDQTKKGVELMIPGIVIGVNRACHCDMADQFLQWICNIKKIRQKRHFSAIDVSLKKRYDLIPNYVETVKGYAKHEIRDIRESRSRKKSGDDSDKYR